MQSVQDLLKSNTAQSLSTPANFRYGQAIYKRGGVEFIELATNKAEAWVGGLDGSVTEGGSQRRRTTLFSKEGELKWHCAGNPKNHQIFCKHCVALALAVIAKPD